jgi:hypothetical protein
MFLPEAASIKFSSSLLSRFMSQYSSQQRIASRQIDFNKRYVAEVLIELLSSNTCWRGFVDYFTLINIDWVARS